MANEDNNWPLPSERWRSFETEPLPVTAYRYDSRLPTVIRNDGFVGYDRTRGVPFFTMFGYGTVFSAGSKKGGQIFLDDDITVFNSLKNDLGFAALKARNLRNLGAYKNRFR